MECVNTLHSPDTPTTGLEPGKNTRCQSVNHRNQQTNKYLIPNSEPTPSVARIPVRQTQKAREMTTSTETRLQPHRNRPLQNQGFQDHHDRQASAAPAHQPDGCSAAAPRGSDESADEVPRPSSIAPLPPPRRPLFLQPTHRPPCPDAPRTSSHTVDPDEYIPYTP